MDLELRVRSCSPDRPPGARLVRRNAHSIQVNRRARCGSWKFFPRKFVSQPGAAGTQTGHRVEGSYDGDFSHSRTIWRTKACEMKMSSQRCCALIDSPSFQKRTTGASFRRPPRMHMEEGTLDLEGDAGPEPD